MGRSYPSRPVVGVGAIILEGDSVLLVERGREPQRGLWSIPGGAVELGEPLVEAVRREVREETGLEVAVREPVEILERILPDAEGATEYHYVLIDYRCEPVGGALRAGDDAADVRWATVSELQRYRLTRGTADVIEKAFAQRGRAAHPVS